MAKKGSKITPTEIITVEEQEKGLDADIILTPQQALFLQLYYDRESSTWGNAKQSAITAGFSEEYSNQITYRKPEWWLGMVRQQDISGLIEQHILEVLSLPNVGVLMGPFGPVEKTEQITVETGEVYKTGKRIGQPKTKQKKIKVPIMVPHVSIIKAKNEVIKLAAPAHDPDRYGKKAGNTNKFVFNMAPMKEKYRT